jgi:hypothetical protein
MAVEPGRGGRDLVVGGGGRQAPRQVRSHGGEAGRSAGAARRIDVGQGRRQRQALGRARQVVVERGA